MRLFLSYASEDGALAKEVYLALLNAGHKVWFDQQSLRAGDDFSARLTAQIRRSDALVFLATPHSIADGSYALTEMEHAREKWPHPRQHLVTVRCKGVAIERLPAWLRQVTLLDEEGAGNLPAEVVRAVAKLRPGRWRRALAVAGGASLALLLLVLGVSMANRDPVEQLLAATLDAGAAMRLASMPVSDSLQRTRARARMLEFLAITTRRPRPLGPCDRRVADSLASREEVRQAVEFIRRPPPTTEMQGSRVRDVLYAVQRAWRGSAVPTTASLDSTNLSGMHFAGADLRGVSFADACVNETVFSDASLQGSRFVGAQGDSAVFTRARLDSSLFAGAHLAGAVFYAACLRRADFSSATLTYARVARADISWASFFEATLTGVDGWLEVDTGRTDALFLYAKGLSAEDSLALAAGGGIVGGTDYPAWKERRDTAPARASTVAACQPETLTAR